ncbi:MAG: DNA methyltransferase, partial [Phascolarctobacterium sp.]
MNDVEQRKAARAFAANWQGKGYEKGESQPFWLQLLGEVLGVEHPAQFIKFEGQVMLDHTSFIDAVIPSTHVLIEQKSIGKNLKQPIRQSDGSLLTPFQQAKRYTAEMPYSERPRWIVVSNFEEFHIYDMEKPYGDPEIIYLKDLPTEYYRLQFLVDSGNKHIQKEMEVSIEAGEIVGKLYDALIKQYRDAKNEQSLRSLNMLCVRLVFCLYAEDAGIFGARNMFHDYLEQYSAKELRRAIIELFKVLDTKQEERDPYLDEDLAAFPYVNGGLFAEENIEIPQFTDEIRELLLTRASADFDWSLISPTIFGAVFESTLNPETRRSGGMHYTSIENIHKVIDPLFLYDLRNEFAKIQEEQVKNRRKQKLEAFQKKLASLTFLDPACGSGNFLTETYISLRRLENEVIRLLTGGEMVLGEFYNPIQVSINQFYGIEINDFAVSVAKTALWIAESQMMKETEDIVHMTIDFLPLKTNAYIVEGNALRIDWESVVPKEKLNYIMGNPPFVGYSLQSKEQKADMLSIYVDEKGKPYKTAGKIDYVAAWYFKASVLMHGTTIRAALVSTNSITQGEQVAGVWKPLYERFGVHIDFAHRTFRWDSEASIKAHVHCVIVGFSCAPSTKDKYLYDEKPVKVENINPYLIDAPNTFIESRNKPLCDVPKMSTGNR